MENLVDVLREQAPIIVDRFYESLFQLPRSKRILDMLSEDELQHLKTQQARNLINLAEPGLKAHDHEKMALRVGRVHAIVGLDREELAHSRTILAASVYSQIGHRVEARVVAGYNRKLSRDLAYQFKAYQILLDGQQNVLLQLMKMVWQAQTYTDLIRQAIDILASHDEIAVCSISRPDECGSFRLEAVAGTKASPAALDLLQDPGQQPVVYADHAFGQGPVSLVWRTGKVQRIVNFLTCPQSLPCYGQVLPTGLRSCAAIPLRAPDQPTSAVLLLFSEFPGGFVGQHQESFLSLLQTILGIAISRLKDHNEGGRIISVSTRQHVAAQLRSDDLQIYYQPLLDMRTGSVGKVEALARLRNGGQMLVPADFFSALSSDDFLALFVRGLNRALSDRKRWLAEGTDLGVSVNLPPAALNDIRYFEATRAALSVHACPADRLTLEVLENELISLHEGQQTVLSRFKSLGIILAQDDLGVGYSGLARLRKLPFDLIKIDRSIVKISNDDDAWEVLRFVYQLTRLGHSLGKSVVVEGVESLDMLQAMAILGVDAVQGYALARPMPFEQVLPWMKTWPGAARIRSTTGMLSRLAEVLLWEERLLLNLKAPGVADKLSRIAHSALADKEAAPEAWVNAECQACPLVCSIFVSNPAQGYCPPEEVRRSAFDAALTEGTDSSVFKAAYLRLVETVLAEPGL